MVVSIRNMASVRCSVGVRFSEGPLWEVPLYDMNLYMPSTRNRESHWSLFVHNHPVAPRSCKALESVPLKLTPDSLSNLLRIVDSLHVCGEEGGASDKQ